MYAETDFLDPSIPYTKKVMVNGQLHNITVLPASPVEYDDTAWRRLRGHQSVNEPMVYDGLGALQDYALTHLDKA